jgi:hypothetical protein
MSKSLLLVASLLSNTAFSIEPPKRQTDLRHVVQLMFAADADVAFGVALDVCAPLEAEDMLDTYLAREYLDEHQQRSYDLIRHELGLLYGQSNGTDGELEQIATDFCDATRTIGIDLARAGGED